MIYSHEVENMCPVMKRPARPSAHPGRGTMGEGI